MNRSKLILFIGLAIFGALITRQFGESWDELKFYKYANLALSAYQTWPTHGTVSTFGDTYDNSRTSRHPEFPNLVEPQE